MVAPNGEITLEQLYMVLYEFQQRSGQILKRNIKKEYANLSEDEILCQIEKQIVTRSDGATEIEKWLSLDNQTDGFANDLDRKIFELRQQGLPYNRIVKCLENQGITISEYLLNKRCKEIYRQRNITEPKITLKGRKKSKDEKKPKQIESFEEEIFEMRECGTSYKDISNYFIQKGIHTNPNAIRKICKKIYIENGLKEPKYESKFAKLHNNEDEEILRLKKQGVSFRNIERIFKERGISISHEGIRKRYNKMIKMNSDSRNETDDINKPVINLDNVDKDRLRKVIENLRKTRNATQDQLNQLAELYEIELDSECIIDWYR